MDPGDTALIIGLASAAVAGLVKLTMEIVKRQRIPSTRPPAPSTPIPTVLPRSSVSGQVRAITRQQEEERLRELEHEAIMSMKGDNARQVELLEIQCELLEDLLSEQLARAGKPPSPPRRSRPDGRYRAKLPSTRGGG
jgi:hypothetical protein